MSSLDFMAIRNMNAVEDLPVSGTLETLDVDSEFVPQQEASSGFSGKLERAVSDYVEKMRGVDMCGQAMAWYNPYCWQRRKRWWRKLVKLTRSTRFTSSIRSRM